MTTIRESVSLRYLVDFLFINQNYLLDSNLELASQHAYIECVQRQAEVVVAEKSSSSRQK